MPKEKCRPGIRKSSLIAVTATGLPPDISPPPLGLTSRRVRLSVHGRAPDRRIASKSSGAHTGNTPRPGYTAADENLLSKYEHARQVKVH
ncbi:hypothetical protein NERG_02737 [Nematocida ausubeli]|nr:hypothetical protein NERG_02737 [Nematocida ausubeli]